MTNQDSNDKSNKPCDNSAGQAHEKPLTTKMLSYSRWQTFRRQTIDKQQHQQPHDDNKSHSYNHLHKQSIKHNRANELLPNQCQRHNRAAKCCCGVHTSPNANSIVRGAPRYPVIQATQITANDKTAHHVNNAIIIATGEETTKIKMSRLKCRQQQNTCQSHSSSISKLGKDDNDNLNIRHRKATQSLLYVFKHRRHTNNMLASWYYLTVLLLVLCSNLFSPTPTQPLTTTFITTNDDSTIINLIHDNKIMASHVYKLCDNAYLNNLCQSFNEAIVVVNNNYHYFNKMLYGGMNFVTFAQAASPINSSGGNSSPQSPTVAQQQLISPDQDILPIQPPPPPPPIPSSSSTMMRPTIFSDATGIVTSQNIGPLMPAPASILSQSTLSLQQQQQQQQQANNALSSFLVDSQDVRINTFKSRLCGANLTQALGMQSGAIDDLSLSASSAHDYDKVGPHLARLNQDLNGGAWCPLKPISQHNFGKEWIQVKLNRSHVISAIETQGRYGFGAGREFVTHYQIEYSRDSGNTWHKWKDFKGNHLLKANEDVSSVVKNELVPPIIGANMVKILPFSQHLRAICLRLELYGCPYDDGAPIAYSMMDGTSYEPRYGYLNDVIYDGQRRLNYLTNGLGQLVDGFKAPDNFKMNHGFGWLGWRASNGDVMIEFQFNTVRNFSGALFHSNNMFSQGIEVFQAIDVQFGIDVALSTRPLEEALQEQSLREQQHHAGGATANLQQEHQSFFAPPDPLQPNSNNNNNNNNMMMEELQPVAARFVQSSADMGDVVSVSSSSSSSSSSLSSTSGDLLTAPAAAATANGPATDGGQHKQSLLLASGSSSGDQTLWSTNVISMEYEPDKSSEEARPVMVHLKQIVANRLRFVLKFASKWILISEVEFLNQAIDSLSLANVHKSLTPDLVSRLSKSRSYDEYLAVLKTDQLRNQAASAFLNGYGTTANSLLQPGPSAAVPQPNSNQNSQNTRLNGATSSSNSNNNNNDELPIQGPNVIFGPKIPVGNGWITASSQQPAQQPQLIQQAPTQMDNSVVQSPVVPPISHKPFITGNTRWNTRDGIFDGVAGSINQPIDGQQNINNDANGITSNSKGKQQQQQQQQQQQVTNNRLSAPTTSFSYMAIGIIVLSSIVLLSVIIFAIFSYRLRKQQTSPLHHSQIHHSHSHHHIKSTSGTGLVGRPGSLINGTGFNSFMNVFTPNGGYSGIFQASPNNSSNNNSSSNSSSNQQVTQGLHTVKRHSSNDSTTGNTTSPSPVLSSNGTGTTNPQTTLLVSLKEPSLFSSMTSKASGQHHHQQGHQMFNTQLIVGMNNQHHHHHHQTLHHPHQQQHHIYNGLNYGTTTNNTYGVGGGHGYSTTMSMASSSNTGDYNEYAIPDAQPMIPPPGTLHSSIQQQQQHQQQQQQLLYHQDLQNRRTLINPHKTINLGNNQSLIYQSGSLANHYEGIANNQAAHMLASINATHVNRPQATIQTVGVPCQLISTTVTTGLNNHHQPTHLIANNSQTTTITNSNATNTTSSIINNNNNNNDTANGSSSPASIGNSATTNTTSASSIGSGGHYYASADIIPSTGPANGGSNRLNNTTRTTTNNK